MRPTSGYVDGMISGATWGLAAVLLAGLSFRTPGHSLLAMLLVIAAVFDAAGALFLLVRSGVTGALPNVLRLLTSRTALTVGMCGLLGGPLFMGTYVAALILAGPSDALTVSATYPVIGALLAQRLLRQRLSRLAWLGVGAACFGAALTAFDASSTTDSARTLAGLALALAAALGQALEGIVATRAMATTDSDSVAAVRELFSATLLAAAALAVPGSLSAFTKVALTRDLYLPIIVAGVIGGISYTVWYHAMRKIGVARAMALNITYAMWGIIFAFALQQARVSLLAVTGCVIVSVGTALTIMSGDGQDRIGQPGKARRWRARLERRA